MPEINKSKSLSEVEKHIKEVLKKYGVDNKITVPEIKKWVWRESGKSGMEALNKLQKKWLSYFPKIENTQDMESLNEVLQVFTDAWNYFSHKSLGGASPYEKAEFFRQNESSQNVPQKLPDIIVGGQKMPWDEYQAMINEIEKRQIPFKKWIDKEVLPKYRRYLEQIEKNKDAREKYYEVADIFLERVLHVGFIHFDEIRKDFIQKEFPRWWPTHVMFNNFTEKQVKDSLKIFFHFIVLAYNKDIKPFGY